VQTTIPYGSWPSPLTAAEVSAAAPRIEGARFVGDDIWWGVTVPEEGGRTTVRRRALHPAPGAEPPEQHLADMQAACGEPEAPDQS
jgi:hypothetical protein